MLPFTAFESHLRAETATAAVQQFLFPSWAMFLRVRRHSDICKIPSYHAEVFCIPLAGRMLQLGSPTLGYIFRDTTVFLIFRYSPPFSSYCSFPKRSLSALHPVEKSC